MISKQKLGRHVKWALGRSLIAPLLPMTQNTLVHEEARGCDAACMAKSGAPSASSTSNRAVARCTGLHDSMHGAAYQDKGMFFTTHHALCTQRAGAWYIEGKRCCYPSHEGGCEAEADNLRRLSESPKLSRHVPGSRLQAAGCRYSAAALEPHGIPLRTE